MKIKVPSFLYSLRFRLIASIVTIEIIMLSILVWNNIHIIHSTHADRLRDTAMSMIQQVSNTTGKYIVSVDYATLELYLKRIMSYEEILYIVVLDRDESAVISLGNHSINKNQNQDEHPLSVDDGVFDVVQRVQVANQDMGKVLMGFSLSFMEDAIIYSRNRGIAIAALEIALTIIVTILIGLRLTRRLAILSSAASEVEAGNYAVNVPTKTKDEIGLTALAFNRMVSEVSSRTQQLENEEAKSRQLLNENRKLVRASLEVQEEERKHLARELHDELGQCLTAIQADAEIIRDLSSGGDKRIATSADAIMSVSARVYDVVHSMMHRLRPGILDNLGLVEALQDEVESWCSRHVNTHCEFSCDGKFDQLDERINITLYRIVQECLTNISKYAQAKNIQVQLLNKDSFIVLNVVDDGIGFDLQLTKTGLGLIGIRERVTALGGEFVLHAASGKGVSIYIKVPAVLIENINELY